MTDYEELYRRLYDEGPIAYLWIGPDGYVQEANRRAAELIGCQMENLVGQSILDLWTDTPDGIEKARGILRNACAQRVIRNEELQMRQADGEPVWVSATVSAVRDGQGQLAGIYLVAVDVTELKRTEVALRVAKDNAENLINSSIDMIVSVDKDRNIVEFNPAAGQAFGYSKEEIVGKPIDLLYADPLSEGLQVYEGRSREGQLIRRIANKRRNGEIFYSHLATAAIRDSQGRTVGAMGIARDITEQMRMETEVRETNQRLAVVNQISSHLSAILDVNQLLAEVVKLVQDTFGYYAAFLALLEDDEIVFRAIACEAGRVRPGHRVKLAERSVPGWVVAHGRALRVPDVTDGVPYYHHPELPHTRSELAVPMQMGNRRLGALAIASDSPAVFDDADEGLLQAIADQLSLALENARSFEETKTQRDEATTMAGVLLEQNDWIVAVSRVTAALLDASDLDTAARVIVNALRTEMGIEKSALWVADTSSDELRLAAALIPNETLADLRPHDEALNQVWRTGRRLTRKQSAMIRGQTSYHNTCFDDWLMLPVKVRDEVLGVLVTERKGLNEDSLVMLLKQAASGLLAARSHGQLQQQAVVLEQTNAEMVRAMQVKSDFLNRMSHELRTPLNAIIGFGGLLKSERVGPLNEKQERCADNIHSSGQHLLSLVNDVLDLAKLEVGKVDLQMEAVDLEDLFNSVVSMLSANAEEKNIRVETDLTTPWSWVTADATRLRQILINLLSNAVKFTLEGGRVVLGAVAQTGPEGQEEILFSVSDTGIGIRREDYPRIFQEFEQMDSPLTRLEEGTGLGLALSKHLVELHGGRIWFESEYGEGTTFFVALPAEGSA